jgi:hypothetical protein
VAVPVAVDDEAARRRSRRGRRRRGGDGDLSPLGVPGAEQPDLVPVYAGPTPADPFGSGHAFDIFDVMEQAELNAAPPGRAPSTRRGGGRSRWQPPHWAVASQPPLLAGQTSADRPDRGPAAEAWALASRPFMMRRDRHTPRWAQHRGTPAMPAAVGVPAMGASDGMVEPPAPHARSVPIESGPPPGLEPAIAAEPVNAPDFDLAPANEPEVRDTAVQEATPLVAREARTVSGAQAELPWTEAAEPAAEALAEAENVAPEAAPVPANDVVSAPVIQPIVIGSESTPPLERKRGWWRRR